MIGYRELDVVGEPITQLPQDLHLEESHDRVGQISKVDWPKAQAGLLMRLFHDWQRVRPRPRGRDSGRPTGLVKVLQSWLQKVSTAFTTNPLLKLTDDLLGTYV